MFRTQHVFRLGHSQRVQRLARPSSSVKLSTKLLAPSSDTTLLNPVTERWLDFVRDTRADSPQPASSVTAALAVTSQQWQDWFTSRCNLQSSSSLESLSKSEALSLLAQLCLHGHTPWALSLWRRCFLQTTGAELSTSSDAEHDQNISSSSLDTLLALSHLHNASDVLCTRSLSGLFPAATSSSTMVRTSLRSISLAYSLISLQREELEQEQQRHKEQAVTTSLRIAPVVAVFASMLQLRQLSPENDKDAAAMEKLGDDLTFWLGVAVRSREKSDVSIGKIVDEIVQSQGGSNGKANSSNVIDAIWRGELDLVHLSLHFSDNPFFVAALGRALKKSATNSPRLLVISCEMLLLPSSLSRQQPQHIMQLFDQLLQVDLSQLPSNNRSLLLRCATVLTLTATAPYLFASQTLAVNANLWRRIASGLGTSFEAARSDDSNDDDDVSRICDILQHCITGSNTLSTSNEVQITAMSEILAPLFRVLDEQRLSYSSSNATSSSSSCFFVTGSELAAFTREWAVAVIEHNVAVAFDAMLVVEDGEHQHPQQQRKLEGNKSKLRQNAVLRFRCESAFVTLCKAVTLQNVVHDTQSTGFVVVSRAVPTKALLSLLLTWPESMWTLPTLEDPVARRALMKELVMQFARSQQDVAAAQLEARFMRLLHTVDLFFRFAQLNQLVVDDLVEECCAGAASLPKSLIQFLVARCSKDALRAKLRESTPEEEREERELVLVDTTSLARFGPWTFNVSQKLEQRSKKRRQSYDDHDATDARQQNFFDDDDLAVAQIHRRYILFGEKLDASFRTFMDSQQWQQALILCADFGSALRRHQVGHQQKQQQQNRNSNNDGKGNNLTITVPSPWIWMAARRATAACFAASSPVASWWGAMQILKATRNLTGCTVSGVALFWRCASLLRRAGRWQQLMEMFSHRNIGSVPPVLVRESDIDSSGEASGENRVAKQQQQQTQEVGHLYLMSEVSAAVQKRVSKSQATMSHDEAAEFTVQVLAWMRAKGFPHELPEQGEQLTSLYHRQCAVSLAVALNDRHRLAEAAHLLVPVTKQCPDYEARSNSREASSRERGFYSDANTVFRRVLRAKKWPAGEWQAAIRFAQHIDRKDLLAIAVPWDLQLAVWQELIK